MATIGVCVFCAVTSVARHFLFYKENTIEKITISISRLYLIFSFAACGGKTPSPTNDEANSSQSQNKVQKQTDHPKIEEISYSFRDTVRYNEPVAAFDYTNNSNYTIVFLQLEFKMKDGVTSEQLQLTHTVRDELITVREYQKWNHMSMTGLYAIQGKQRKMLYAIWIITQSRRILLNVRLMDLTKAEIHFIGDDTKEHVVLYNAENKGYKLLEQADELFTWIDNDFAKQIPKPETRVAHATMSDDDNKLYIKAYDISYDAFLSYVNECEKKGFQNNYPDEEIDYSYGGTNADGYELDIRFIDYMQYIEIVLEKADT